MVPESPRARRWLSIWFVFHLVCVVNYVWIEEAHKRWLRPISKPYVEWLQLTQKWNMFRNPGRADVFIEAEGVTADGAVVPLPISHEPPAGPFWNMRYDRTVKIHNIIAYEDEDGRYRAHYARSLCVTGPYTRIHLFLKTVAHLSPAQMRTDPTSPRTTTRAQVEDVACP